MQLEDWLDDLCVRFIINLPPEELASVERICFQVEEAQWFYEDFIRPLDPSLPSLSLKQFSLAIFQHCPLFSTWSAQHHTTAFAEFLAYKQRVPVRGAIMLNDAMDEVVLVKGWKKGANWSFPRGKINKDEHDLDCAVREVYEETGFDIKAAGLVKPERDMKYIEITMREQHMRLYVFRGVPKTTHFEPRTRKEISKIEWYRLTDLPTLKKKTHQDGSQEHAAMNANKFYMVAPFLHPLKKWIAQQRKKEGRHSSNLAVPPVLAEESATENELTSVPLDHGALASPRVLSTLPEVLPSHMIPHDQDPSTHLKEILNIGGPEPAIETVAQPTRLQGADVAKSNALLALLRNGSASDVRQPSQTSFGQLQSQPIISEQPASTSHNMTTQPLLQAASPAFPIAAISEQQKKQNLLQLFGQNTSQPAVSQTLQPQPVAPYQRTGDPQFARDSPEESRSTIVPPANALPKLTHHTKTLLDAFKSQAVGQIPTPTLSAPAPQLAPSRQALLDAFRSPGPSNPVRANLDTVPATLEGSSIPSVNMDQRNTPLGELSGQSPAIPASQTFNLADLFKRPSIEPQRQHAVNTQERPQQAAPVELAAAPVKIKTPDPVTSQTELLAALFRKDKVEAPRRQRSPVAKAGQTGATISGPINQPQFDGIAKTQPDSDTSIRRSPVPSHRTLFDPKQPVPVKILARPGSSHKQAPRSPRAPKAQPVVSSPKRTAKSQTKAFQPQILRRPQVSESRESPTPSPSSLAPIDSTKSSRRPSNLVSSSPSPNFDQPATMSLAQTGSSRRVSEQSDSHKQNLLSLFSGPSPPAPTSYPPIPQTQTQTQSMFPPPIRPISTAPSISGLVSPMATSQIISPLDEPISTRSRVGSLASITSPSIGPGAYTLGGTGGVGGLGTQTPLGSILGSPNIDGRSKAEKRQTAAEDKAFLLGYLGRIASQDG